MARALIDTYSETGELVLDPFCGSGTTLVESMVAGRHSIGYDVDPVAVFVSQAKTRLYNIEILSEVVSSLRSELSALRNGDLATDGPLANDVSESTYESHATGSDHRIPAIPNLKHWFRRRVTLQLCRIRDLFEQHSDGAIASFLKLCFASIIRNASNADPVPVSGLEVTSYMLKREREGRIIDPYDLAARALDKNLKAVASFQTAIGLVSPRCTAARRDASETWLDNVPKADVVITSPPYLNAVDYYRRHTLEMYWLGLVESHAERLELSPRYIGRARPRRRDALANRTSPSRTEIAWTERLNRTSPVRAYALMHYAATMQAAIENQAKVLKKGGRLVLVVGNSRIQGEEFPTAELLVELSSGVFEPNDDLWYPVRNRYMSYSRRNGASISTERVVVLRRT